jgi:hypothetical protein
VALTTVLLSLVLLGPRFFAVGGLHGRGAAYYLAGSVALLAAVSVTGYFGGIMAGSPQGAPHGLPAPPVLPAKLLTVLLVVLAGALLTLWLVRGEQVAPRAYCAWREAVQQPLLHRERGERGDLWTLQHAGRGWRSLADDRANADGTGRWTDAGEAEHDLGTAAAGGRTR